MRIILIAFRALALIALIASAANLMIQLQTLSRLEVFPPSSLVSLRSSMPVLGGPTKNDALLILFLLFVYTLGSWCLEEHLDSVFSWVARVTLPLLFCVLVLSFSRGIYLALLALFVCLATWIWRERIPTPARMYKAGIGGLVFSSILLGRLGVVHAVVETSLMVANKSQQRSVSGRFGVWSSYAKLLDRHLLLGWGWFSGGRLTLAANAVSPERVFSARAYNAPLELLTSAGLISGIMYLAFAVLAFKKLATGSRDHVFFRIAGIVVGSGLVAAYIRDMTYSSIVTQGTCILLSLIGFAIMQNVSWSRQQATQIAPSILFSASSVNVLSMLVCLVSLLIGVSLRAAETEYSLGCASLQRGDLSNAVLRFSRVTGGPWHNPVFYSARGLAFARSVIKPYTSPQMTPVPLSEQQRSILLRATADYIKAAQLSPDDSNYWCNLGWLNFFVGNDQSATAYFGRAVAVDPYDAVSHLSLGLSEERSGREDRAADEYGRALALSPRLGQSEFWDDLTDRKNQIATAAVTKATMWLRGQPDSPINAARLASIDAMAGRDELAHIEYQEAASALPNLPYPWVGLGEEDIKRGDRQAAILDLQRAVVLDPSNRRANTRLSQLLIETGQPRSAEVFRMQAILSRPQTVHSERVTRIYHEQPSDLDDLLPPGLMALIEPAIP